LTAHRWEGRLYIRAVDIDAAIENAATSAKLSSSIRNGPRAVAAAEGLATRSDPRDS
jgi:hypothetical protein